MKPVTIKVEGTIDPYTVEGVVALILKYIQELSDTQNELHQALKDEASKHKVRIAAEASAWKKVQGRNREERDAYVNEMCMEEIYDHESSQAESKSLLKKVDGMRQSLSALQSVSKSVEAEAAFHRVGQDSFVDRVQREAHPAPVNQRSY